MAFATPFKRGSTGSTPTESARQHAGDEVVIDVDASDVIEEPGTSPIPRSAAVPEAGSPQALAKRSDREIAVRNVAVATAGGLVAGAATIAVAAVAKSAAKNAAAPTPGLSRRRKRDIQRSQSFLVDVHVLKPGR